MKRRADDPAALRVDPGQGAVGGARDPDRPFAGGEPERRGPDRDRRGDRDVVVAEEQEERRDQRREDRGSDEPPPRQRAHPPAQTPPFSVPLPGGDGARRRLGAVAEDPGRGRGRALALARRLDQGAGAGVAIARVLGDGSLDHGVEAGGHLRLGVAGAAGEGDDPGQRLVEDAAERVDVGGGADVAGPATARATCTRRCRRSRRR